MGKKNKGIRHAELESELRKQIAKRLEEEGKTKEEAAEILAKRREEIVAPIARIAETAANGGKLMAAAAGGTAAAAAGGPVGAALGAGAGYAIAEGLDFIRGIAGKDFKERGQEIDERVLEKVYNPTGVLYANKELCKKEPRLF